MRTPYLHIPEVPIFRTGHERVVYLGSCFTERLYAGLTETFGLEGYSRIEVCNHFNPTSLADMIDRIQIGRPLGTADVYPSYVISRELPCVTTPYLRAHYGMDPASLLRRGQIYEDEFASRIRTADVVILTVGTADVAVVRESNRTTCSVNYMPSELYHTRMLSVEELQHGLRRIRRALDQLAGATVPLVVTISPQRYFSYGTTDSEREGQDYVRNENSKARLKVAVDSVVQEMESVIYFPAYEIVIDERRWVEPLSRDDDFQYVSDDTGRYVVDRFITSYFTEGLRQQLERIRRIRRVIERARRHPQLVSLFQPHLEARLQELMEMVDPSAPHIVCIARECASVLGTGG